MGFAIIVTCSSRVRVRRYILYNGKWDVTYKLDNKNINNLYVTDVCLIYMV